MVRVRIQHIQMAWVLLPPFAFAIGACPASGVATLADGGQLVAADGGRSVVPLDAANIDSGTLTDAEPRVDADLPLDASSPVDADLRLDASVPSDVGAPPDAGMPLDGGADTLDSDSDLLHDASELLLGTDPTDPDSDDDGLPDGWEIHGHGGTDYAALGCSPLHRDLLVEVDYHHYIDGRGVLHSARIGDALNTALVNFYSNLPIRNRDGVDGIHAVFVSDTELPDSHRCYDGEGPGGDHSPWDPRHALGFRKLTLCLGPFRGNAQIAGRSAKLRSPEPNQDPSDDLTEVAQYHFFRGIIHELGHSMGLTHGGDVDVNNKPNYPSVMNYSYDKGTDGGRENLGSNSIQFSDGTTPDINECALTERTPFAPLERADIAFLAFYQPRGFDVRSGGSVDWDRDGILATEPYAAVIRAGADIGERCRRLRDVNDYAILERRMGAGLMSDPD